MEKINLPDGTFLELPSNLPPSERDQIAAEVQQYYGVDINDVSLLDRVTDFPKSVVRGTASLIADVPLGLSALTTGTQSGLTQGLQGFQDYLRTESVLASDPKLRDTFTTKLAEGAGSFVPFLGAGAAGFRLAQKGIVGPLTGQLGVPAAIAVPTGIAQQADRIDMARAGGEDVGAVTEKLSLLMGGAIGTTEVLPVASLFRRIPKNVLKYPGVADRLKSAAITGAAEGGQEVFASIAQDLVARGFYSDELPIGESLFEEFTIGGIIGGTADLVVNSMNRRSVAVESLKSMEENARANATKNLSDEKFRRAQEAGIIREFQEQPVVNIPTIPLPENLSDAPDLQVIQNADETFSVVDVNNVEQPVLQVFQEEGKAVGFKNKTESNFERKRLATEVANANFDLGLQDSATAQVFGSTVLDPNNTEINIQTLLNFDPTLKDEQRTELQKEKSTLFVGDKTYAEMIANRSDRLPLITKYLTDKGLPLRSSFTLTEAKNVLKNREFNNLTKSLSEIAFQQNENAGQQSLRDGEKIDTSVKAYKDLAETKNIDLDFNDPAIQFASERWTGFKDIRKTRSKGARELFLARLQSIPDFSVKTKFPDYRPRTYTPQDLQNFVNAARNRNFEFTKDDIAILNPPFLQGSKESAEQFFNDLVNSQRAIPTADGKFTINPNYEFDIARKAEGFAETPQEFGDRLRQEGKLPEDIIEALVAKEELRQEGLIPPKPLEEKFIDFAEAVSEGRVNKFAKEAKAILNKRGLKETGVIISDDILSTTTITRDPQTRETLFDPTDVRDKGVRGEYDKNTDIIFISLNAINPDGNLSDAEISKRIKGILDHEMIHALRFKDLITEAEYQFLTKETKRRKVPEAVDKRAFDAGETFYTRAVRNYKSMAEDPRYGLGPEAREEFYVEEAIAELFRHRDVVPTAPKKVDGIFNKIVQFFKDLGTAFRQSGFSKASEVFSALETGRVGGRARGEIRTLMYSDQLPIGARAEQTAVEIPDDRSQEELQEVSEYNAAEAAEGYGPGAIGTPAPIVSDTDPITGIVVEPRKRFTGSIFNRRERTEEELEQDKENILNDIGYGLKDSFEVLDTLIKKGPKGDYRLIAQRLRDQMLKIKENVKDIDFRFRIIQKGTDRFRPHHGMPLNRFLGQSAGPFMIDGRQTMAIYINDTDSIKGGDRGQRGGLDYETILHEFVHQATQVMTNYYPTNRKLTENIAELETIRKTVKKELQKVPKAERDFYVEYGLQNIDEFLAVGFTDRTFQKYMESIPYGEKQTLWDKFTTVIRKILGIPARANTAFSNFLKNGAKITNLSNQAIRDVFGTAVLSSKILSTPPRPPTFNIATDSSIPVRDRISRLEDRLFRLEREQQEEGATMTTDSLNRLQGRINQTKREIEFLSNPTEETAPTEITEQLPLFSVNPNTESIPSFAKMKGSGTVYRKETNKFGDRLRATKNFMFDLLPNSETWLGRLYPFHMRELVTKKLSSGEDYTRSERREDKSKRLYKTENPAKDETINNIRRASERALKSRDFISSFGRYIKQSRQAIGDASVINPDGTINIKQVPLKEEDYPFINVIANDPVLKNHMDWFLSQFTNKRGNLIVYRGLNNPPGFKLTESQSPLDDFSSTSLIREDLLDRISVPTRKLPLGSNAQAVLDSARSELSPVALDEMLGGQILNPDKAREREEFEQLKKDLTDTAILPQTIYRFEVPLDRVKAYVPYVKSLIEDSRGSREIDLSEAIYDADYEAGGGFIPFLDRPQREDYENDSDFEEAFAEYESEFEQEKLNEIENLGYTDIEEAASREVEVIVDLEGIQPQLEYMPSQEILGERFGPSLKIMQRGKRDSAIPGSSESKQLQQAVDKAEEITKTMANGEIPPYNLNASDVALKAAIDFNEDPTAPEPPDDIPKFSAGTIPESYQDTANRIDANYTAPTKSFGARMIDLVKDPITEIRPFFNQFRTQIIDKYDPIAKKLIKGGQENEDVRIANNDATTSAIVAIRMADRARGIFQGLLNVGYVKDTIQGEEALSNVVDLPISTRFNPFLEGDQNTGGLVQIFMPLYSDPTIDKERIFKMYATLKRVKNLQENGREVEVPATPQDLEQIQNIEKDFPEVVEAYDNYQNWNNRLIDFAQAKGILDQQQAETWKKHSSYYPFYRVMVDESLGGPRIAAGVLPNNPLSIELKGSEDPLQIGPVEAISRNSLSILTAALKNDGVGKLVRDLEAMDSAREITDRAQLTGKDVISYFEDGTKKYIELDDTDVFHAIRGIGGVSTDFVTNALGFPARILRDTVTRDPGFVVVNLLRDTLSAAVTSGAPLGIGGEKFTPIIDTVQNMFGDMKELERFGVLGGYDFQNDEGSVKTFVDRAMREKGLNPDNSMSPQNLFFKVWDGLGALTTKSDGATRLAVYESVYNKMKKDGASEAQAQSEAAFQALEIINFGRRGLSPAFRIITSAIPFLNARIQGLDVLWRAGSGQYSAIEKLEDGQSPKELQRKIQKAMLMRGGALIGLTAMYYALVSDTDEYKNLRREVRDDNWIIPLGDGIPAIKIPIPFEVGMLFKAIPERLFDVAMGEDALSRQAINEAIVSIKRQLGTSANIPFFEPAFGIQALKPIAEVYNNRNTFTNTEIIPYYQTKLEPGLQQRASTNELARQLGEAFNISPIKIEYIARGYTGTLGGYVLDIIDSVTRGVTGTPLIPPDIRSVPVLNRLLIDLDRSGGLQQQFYELRNEVDTVVQTMNRLRKDRRFDELSAYRTNNQGVMNVKSQIRAIDRYLEGWRKRRDTLLRRDDLSPFARRNALEELELERDKRLAIVPELRKNANVPISQVGTF